MKKTKLILFDFDGVIIDSAKDGYEVTNYTLRKLNLPEKNYEEVQPTMSKMAHERFATWIDDEKTIQEAVRMYREYQQKEITKRTRLFPNAKETISELCQDYRLGIVSNKVTPVIKEILINSGLAECFDVVLGSDMVKNPKPNPEGILTVLEAMEIDPDEAFMVGDTNIDIIAGKAAGVKTIGVTYGGIGNQEDLENSNPDYLIDNFTEILNVPELTKKGKEVKDYNDCR